MTTFSGSQHGHAPRGDAVEVLAHAVLELGQVDVLSRLATPIVAEVPDRLGRVAAAAQAAQRRHARVVPAVDVPSSTSSQQLALAHDRVGQVEPGELDLLRVGGVRRPALVLDEPVVERAVVLELQRAERVGDALDRVALAVGPVVHRVDAPLVAGAVVRRVQDAVHHRVAHVHVGRGHVDLRPQHARAVGNSPARMRREQVEVLLGGRSR
jgi:hypothetical protein